MKNTKKNQPNTKGSRDTGAVPSVKFKKKSAVSHKAARAQVRKRPVAGPSPPRFEREVTHLEIATRAYFIYVNEGRPSGEEMRHWLEAESQLRGE
ncbi:MAG: DUF2934 domain-containing protein [Verrucomicrobiales bacterium]|nr:DUF2934 domain-containing protein [Verrucomicrobiales bacterium]